MANGVAEKVTEVVGKVLKDPKFAAQIQQEGLAALQGGSGSAAWKKYFDNFAATPGQLSGLGTTIDAAGCTCNSTTVTTLTTAVTPIPTCCGITVTTTTSG